MALPNDNVSMALYCDFENVALGVRDAKYDKFDIKPVLERLLLKGSIVLKKAYCDWERYKEFKPQMHEASFELIEIPHVRQSGKNSADIRMVVDALDLCYTKAHVNTFVIISGDSDFSPLVSKLRENAKYVIGVGVRNSTSDLLISNCDEFIFIDDLVREARRQTTKREVRQAPPMHRLPHSEEQLRKEDLEVRKTRAIEIATETFEALLVERGDSGKIWASTLKQAIKRRKPDFNETALGFRSFGNVLEEAQARGLMEVGRDDKSGAYVFRSNPIKSATDLLTPPASRLRASSRSTAGRTLESAPQLTDIAPVADTLSVPAIDTSPTEDTIKDISDGKRRAAGRKATSRKKKSDSAEKNNAIPAMKGEALDQSVPEQSVPEQSVPEQSVPDQSVPEQTEIATQRKPVKRTRRPRKSEIAPSGPTE